MIQGEVSKTFNKAKSFLYQHPEAARHLFRELSNATIEYLHAQIEAGAQAIQRFDSWAGLLSPEDFNEWAYPANVEIISAIKKDVPVILLAKGAWYALERMALQSGEEPLGQDQTRRTEHGRTRT